MRGVIKHIGGKWHLFIDGTSAVYAERRHALRAAYNYGATELVVHNSGIDSSVYDRQAIEAMLLNTKYGGSDDQG